MSKADQIAQEIIAGMEARLNQTVPATPLSVKRVLAKVMAGLFVELHYMAEQAQMQHFPQTAHLTEIEANGVFLRPLEALGAMVGVSPPTDAVPAELSLSLDVTDQGGTLPAGTQFYSSTNGVTYATKSAVELNLSTVTLSVIAVADSQGGDGSGAIGNLPVGAVLSLVSPVAGVASSADIPLGGDTVTGVDAETEDAYRERVLARFATQPKGGAFADYREWALEVPGVIGCWPYADDDAPGGVELYIEASADTADDADGTPTTAQLAAVLNAVEMDANGLATRRPVGANITSASISRKAFNVEVFDVTASDTAAVQAAATAAITAYLLGREPYVPGLTLDGRKDQITQAEIGGVVAAVVGDANGTFSSVVLKDGSTAITSYTLAKGEKAKAGTVSYLTTP